MTTPPFSSDTFPLTPGIADARLLRKRVRSVLTVQPPSDIPDAFVVKAIAALHNEVGGDEKVKQVTEALAREGLSEAVARATAKLNAGGLDRRWQRDAPPARRLR